MATRSWPNMSHRWPDTLHEQLNKLHQWANIFYGEKVMWGESFATKKREIFGIYFRYVGLNLFCVK